MKRNMKSKHLNKKNFKSIDLLILVSSLLIVIGSLIFVDTGITTAAIVNLQDCGTLSSSGTYLLTQDISSPGTCFTIKSNNLNLDCRGHKVTHSINGSAGQNGISIQSFNNLTVQNCVIIDGNKTSNEINNGINSISSIGSSFINNTIIMFGTDGKGISIRGGRDAIIDKNNISMAGSSSVGVSINNAYRSIIRFNIINATSGGSSRGIYNSGDTKDALMEGNIIRGYYSAIDLSGSVNRTVLVNNDLLTIISGRPEISTSTLTTSTNYLVYNNTFGEIRWIDDNSGGFLQSLNVNSPNPNGFGLGKGIFIGPNLITVDVGALGGQGSLIDSNVLITLKQLPFADYINEVRRTNTVEVNSAAVLSQGNNCLGTSCLYFCYNKNDHAFKFTSFSLSGATTLTSFAANQNPALGPIYVQEDVDGNGVIDDFDINLLVNHIIDANKLRGAAYYSADVTCDAVLNVHDIESIVNAR